MTDRKILLLILSVIIYCMYSAHMWFAKHGSVETSSEAVKYTEETVRTKIDQQNNDGEVITNKTQTLECNNTTATRKTTKTRNKSIPLYIKNRCSILQVFTQKPIRKSEAMKDKLITENNALTALCITIFLMVLSINAVLDTLKAKEEEKVKRKLNPDGERRQSLAEFANKKSLRRESSKFGLQMFQIAESMLSKGDEKKERQPKRPYTRGDSTNSYLSENKSSPATTTTTPIGETTTESRLTKRQSVSKLFGYRTRSIERRSSFPALPLNPDIQAMMLGHRQPSVDSDDEDKGRRVRIIRRY